MKLEIALGYHAMLVSLVVFLSSACLPVECSPSDIQSRSLTASGKIVDSEGRPVPDATVYLREWLFARKAAEPDRGPTNDVLATTITTADGAFSFSNVSLPKPYLDEISMENPQPWDVVVTAKGFGVAWARLPFKGYGQKLVLTLPRAATLRGRVTDTEGNPVSNAQVRALRFQGLEQPLQSPVTHAENLRLDGSDIVFATATDAAGEFSLGGQPPEMRIVLQVKHPDFARRLVYTATTDQPQPPVTVGRTRTAAGASTPREEPVQIGHIKAQLRPGHRLRIHAMLADNGKPAAGAVLRQISGATRLDVNVVANAEGEFHLGQLGAGRYTFEIFVPGQSKYLGARVLVTIQATERDVAVEAKLSRGVVVGGRVVDEDGNKGIAGVRIVHQPATNDALNFATTAETDTTGRFRIAVPPGNGMLEITNHVPGYVTPDDGVTARTEADERFVRPSNVVEGKPPPEVVFTLSRGLVAVVQIADPEGKPAAGAEVNGTLADRDGELTISGLFPFRNHELIATLPARNLAGRFTVSPRGEKQPVSVQVALHPMGSVAGRVLGEDRKPIPKASVQLLQHVPDAETKIVFYASSGTVPIPVNSDGSFTIHELIPGIPYNVNVTAPGHASAFGTPFDGTAGTTHRLSDIILPRADQSVAGSVIDPLGRPVAGVQVFATPVRAGGIDRSVRISGGQVFSDTDGRFRLTGIPRGPVRLSAYITPRGGNEDKMVRTHAALKVEAGEQNARLLLAGPDVISPPEAFVGKPAPEFAVKVWLNVENVAERNFCREAFSRGPLLLAFMDESRPSTLLLKHLNEWHHQWADKGLTVMRVYETAASTDDLAKHSPTAAAIVAPGLVPGGYSEAFQKYAVRAMPTVILIDRDGIIRVLDPDMDSIAAHLDMLFQR